MKLLRQRVSDKLQEAIFKQASRYSDSESLLSYTDSIIAMVKRDMKKECMCREPEEVTTHSCGKCDKQVYSGDS